MLSYFSKGEKGLWIGSVLLIVGSFLAFDRSNCMTLAASIIGTTSLILNAKGNPIGQVLMILFSLLYGWISYTFSYYGEMITYLGMTAPMSVIALISWMKNPYQGNKTEVKVNQIKKREQIFMWVMAIIATIIFGVLLHVFRTAYIIPSTISVTTSFLAVYLTYYRSPYYAIAYAANDVVLIVLWVLASLDNMSYLSVVVCFLAFLVNDIYGFISWKKRQWRQNQR